MRLHENYKIFPFLLLCFSFCLYSEQYTEEMVVLGSGPAGLTAAIYAGQANLHPLVIEGDECEGQLVTVYHMENFPGFPDGINGEELVQRIRLQAQKFGARFLPGKIMAVDLSHQPFAITLTDGNIIETKSLVVAVGSSKRWLGLEAEELLKGKGISSSATCEASLFEGKEVVVAGGGDAALEEALAAAEYASKVTLVHRSSALNASSYLKEKVSTHPRIEVILNAAIEEILDLKQDKVTALILRDVKTNKKTTLPCEGLFVAIGRQPNTDLFKGQLNLTSAGLIELKSVGSSETNIPGVFAAGDVCDPTYRKAIIAAGSGCKAAMDAIRFHSTQSNPE
jgi:thioredoxin reductase (NADPH)